jgi:hypothetical protein
VYWSIEMTTTIIVRKDGQTIERTGTSGFTVTSTRLNNDVDVLIEFDDASPEESVVMIGMLLVALDERHGENFVAQCFNHYAEEVGLKRTRIGDRDLVKISGYSNKPLSKRRRK